MQMEGPFLEGSTFRGRARSLRGLGEKSTLHGARACGNNNLPPISRGIPVTNPLLSLPYGPSLTGPQDLIPSPSLTQPVRKLEGSVGSPDPTQDGWAKLAWASVWELAASGYLIGFLYPGGVHH